MRLIDLPLSIGGSAIAELHPELRGVVDVVVGGTHWLSQKGRTLRRFNEQYVNAVPTAFGEAAISLESIVNARLEIAPSNDLFPVASTTTIAVYRRCRDTTARNATIFGYDAGATDRVLCHGPFSDGTLYWDFGNGTAGSGRVSVAFTKTTQWEALVFVAGPTKGREVWRNTTRIASNTSATASRSSSSAVFPLGARSTGASPDNEDIALFVVSSVEWSDAEIRRWALDPFGATFAPRRIWVPVSAGGGGASVIGAADGTSTASTLAGSSQAQAALTAAAGTSTASTLVGSAIAVSTTSAAAGASTAGALAGSSLAMSAIAAAAGVSSAQTLTATSTAVASITQAAGAGSAQSLVGASVALASITPAEGSSTASTLAAVGGDLAAITPADGTSTASSLAGSSTAVSGITTAAGAGTASTVAGASVAVAAITPAAGVSTAATMEPAAAAPSAITPAAGASTSATLAGLSVAVAAIVPADGASTTGTLADANAAPPPPAPAPSPSGGRPPYVEPNPAAEWLARLIADDAQILALLQEQVDAGVFN